MRLRSKYDELRDFDILRYNFLPLLTLLFILTHIITLNKVF